MLFVVDRAEQQSILFSSSLSGVEFVTRQQRGDRSFSLFLLGVSTRHTAAHGQPRQQEQQEQFTNRMSCQCCRAAATAVGVRFLHSFVGLCFFCLYLVFCIRTYSYSYELWYSSTVYDYNTTKTPTYTSIYPPYTILLLVYTRKKSYRVTVYMIYDILTAIPPYFVCEVLRHLLLLRNTRTICSVVPLPKQSTRIIPPSKT